jgi:hypothetical protein
MKAVRPLFRCAWERVVMIHYEADPRALQPQVPFPLDLHGGRAFVSLVAFTLRDMQFRFGGPPLTTHGFLNVRTYVRVGDELGIFFLAEWLSNPLCVMLGPRVYGLPYRRGRLIYRHRHETGSIAGRVEGATGALQYRASIAASTRFQPATRGSRDEFLLERYAAFTRNGLFRVEHEPWRQAALDVTVEDDRLMEATGPWFRHARRAGAHYSPGFSRVWMGRPLPVADTNGGPGAARERQTARDARLPESAGPTPRPFIGAAP